MERECLLADGVPFVEFAVFVKALWIDPGLFVFAEEAVAAEDEAVEEAVLFDGIEGVLGT